MNRSDPFGLCPPTNTDIRDCDATTSLGAAWIALDAGGDYGRDVIEGIVEKGIAVSLASAPALRTVCGPSTAHGCLKGKMTIHLNADDPAGVLAVTIAHEWFHHGQAERGAEDVRGQAADEIEAFVSVRPVYTSLRDEPRKEARAAFQNAFDKLATRQGRMREVSRLCKELAADAGVSDAKC